MQDGLYGVKFQTPLGAGAGVLVKQGERVVGGDTAFAWDGHLTSSGGELKGRLDVQRHDSGMPSVFGPVDTFVLDFKGSAAGDKATLQATTPSVPGVTLSIALTRLKGV
jgi:hypothetical protein